MSFRICHLGKKNIKMESGETIDIPNVIRLMIPSRVVEQYDTFCKEQEFEPLSKLTLESPKVSRPTLDHHLSGGF